MSPRARAFLAPALLALALVALYGPALGFGFLNIDDDYVIEANPYLHGGPTPPGAPPVPEVARRAPLWAAFAARDRFWMGSEWLPLTTLSLKLDAALWGRWAPGYRLTHLVLAIAAAWLLYSVLRRLLGAPGKMSTPALLAALWFALHPLHVENTAWLAMRKDLLAGCFGLLAWDFFTRFQDRPGTRPYVFSLVCFALALLSKATAIFLAPLFLAQMFLRRSPRGARALLLWLPFACVALADFAMVYAIGASEGIVRAAAPPWSQVLLTDLAIVLHYLELTVLPGQLCALYLWPSTTAPDLTSLVAVVLLGLWLAIAWRERRRAPLLSLAVVFALLALVPVLNVFPKSTRVAERFAWFFTAGVALGLAWLLQRALARPGWRRPVLVGCAALIGLVGLRAGFRVQDFRDSEALCRSIVDAPHPAPHAWVYLGKALYAKERWEESLGAFERARRELARPDFSPEPRVEQRLGSGAARLRLGRFAEALTDYAWVLERFPRHPIALAGHKLASEGLRERESP